MKHFEDTKAWIVCTRIAGRSGMYGATTSVVGFFNSEKRADAARYEFINQYRKVNSKRECRGIDNDVFIKVIKPGVIDEQIISEVYE